MSLTSNQQSSRQDWTHSKTITADDLVEATTVTAETVPLFEIPADGIVEKVAFYLNTAFDDTAGDLDQMLITVGDSDVDGFIVSAELALDGTELSSAVNTGAYFNDGTTANAVNQKVYDVASATTMNAIFTPVGTNSSNLLTSVGSVTVMAKIVDFSKAK
jgi:hypothetical protein